MSTHEILIWVMAGFAVLGALDRIFGNRLGLGKEFEDGIQAMGSLALAMVGIIAIAPVLIALETDMAKALGHALSLRLPKDTPLLCIDRVKLSPDSYLDIGAPVGPCLPVVVKTLVLSKQT